MAHSLTILYIPKQNGYVERHHGQIQEMGMLLLSHPTFGPILLPQVSTSLIVYSLLHSFTGLLLIVISQTT